MRMSRIFVPNCSMPKGLVIMFALQFVIIEFPSTSIKLAKSLVILTPLVSTQFVALLLSREYPERDSHFFQRYFLGLISVDRL